MCMNTSTSRVGYLSTPVHTIQGHHSNEMHQLMRTCMHAAITPTLMLYISIWKQVYACTKCTRRGMHGFPTRMVVDECVALGIG